MRIWSNTHCGMSVRLSAASLWVSSGCSRDRGTRGGRESRRRRRRRGRGRRRGRMDTEWRRRRGLSVGPFHAIQQRKNTEGILQSQPSGSAHLRRTRRVAPPPSSSFSPSCQSCVWEEEGRGYYGLGFFTDLRTSDGWGKLWWLWARPLSLASWLTSSNQPTN